MKNLLLHSSLLFCSLAMTALADEIGVRIRFGMGDDGPTDWSGSISVSPGKVALLSGWRFEKQDAVLDTKSWTASTHPLQLRGRSNNPGKAGKGQGKAKARVRVNTNGILATLSEVTEDSEVRVTTAQGVFSFKLSEIPYGTALHRMESRVDVDRTAATRLLVGEASDDDFPAMAAGPGGGVDLAHVSFTPGLDRDSRSRSFEQEPEDLSYLDKPTGGDRVWLRRLRDGAWGKPIAVTEGGGDIYKCAVAVDTAGTTRVIWSERKEGQFHIWARALGEGGWSEVEKVSQGAGNHHSPVATADSAGNVWVAWQGADGGVFRIFGRKQSPDGTWSEVMAVSPEGGNCWAPAIAADGSGKVAAAWDTYDRGDYDVWVREMGPGDPGEARPAANTPDYEARPSLTYDRDGNLWVAWEQSGPSWGKDWGAYEKEDGIPLYSDRTIGLRVWSDGVWKEPKASLQKVLPGPQAWDTRGGTEPGPAAGTTTRVPGQHAVITGSVSLNNLARLTTDGAGRPWLILRSKMGTFRSPLGTVWMNHAIYLDGENWVGPVLLSHSDNLLYNLPAAVGAPGGGLLVAHSSDHRQTKQAVWEKSKVGQNQVALSLLESTEDPFINHLYVSRFQAPGEAAPLALQAATSTPAAQKRASEATEKEREDVERIRAYRATVEGKELRILRGEFHRHTEISGDGGNDGPLEDMWRYAMDVAMFDWIGNGDHDNGGHREYPWWLIQKTTDAFHLPGVFDPLFTYERSVKYPEGHRNVVFVQRGVRTLPRLPISSELKFRPAPDTQMLYKYLHQFGGICASHTSATDMGTDWRDNDPVVEPFVEIYQGARQNYERPGAPRAPTEDDAIGGWRPKGFVNLALKMGYRLAFQSSSDHRSTHISYCNVYAGEATRQGIFDAMKTRHVYGATDNIIADYRCRTGGREHMMGDEFAVAAPPELEIKLVGTAPFAKVVLIKDDVEVYTVSPNEAEVAFMWTDPDIEAGVTSYYYVRGEQADGELVWVSPMWIKYAP